MHVIKRDGSEQAADKDKIIKRIENLAEGLSGLAINVIADKVFEGTFPGVLTRDIDTFAAETAADMTTQHPDHATLAARIAVSSLHKDTSDTFSDVMRQLYTYVNPETNKPAPLISDETWATVEKYAERLDSVIDYELDFTYTFFGYKTLERSYLLRTYDKITERPQQMLMRVAVGIHQMDIDSVLETYRLLSQKHYTQASPTLFNAGTPKPQLSSCFLLEMKDDSIDGIYDTLKTCAMISKTAGGIGLNIHKIRASGSYIAGTNGYSNGLVPMLRVFNNTARYVDQGGNKRPGAFAMYLEPWHADVEDFLDLKKNTGKDEQRARDLFFALWIPDMFMRRVEANAKWSLMCPHECPGLADVHSKDFDDLYERYEKEGKFRRQVEARELWNKIIDSQVETGTPYMLYKDACNAKSNQQNLGTIKCSNLCTEIVQYSSPDEVAVCNLASVALNKFVKADHTYDFQQLHDVVQVMTRNCNRIIDVNYYPVPEARRSNMRHRPIGLGVQGLADAFILMRFPYESAEAQTLNVQIFETIYHAALTASVALAKRDGTYETYEGSPVSKGVLQHDMWNRKASDLWDWDTLRADIKEHGVRNSLLVAPMPTASTAQILGNNESTEPYQSNIFVRRVLSGEFTIVNTHLMADLVRLGLWSLDMKNTIIAHGGSIQKITDIPADVRALYKTVWEIKQKTVLKMAADRGAFIDQSQSLNIHIPQPSTSIMTSCHFAAWKSGLKTGMYYLRSRPAASAIQFTVDQNAAGVLKENNGASKDDGKQQFASQAEYEAAKLVCSRANPEACVMCSG